MGYDPARVSLDRHATYIVATSPPAPPDSHTTSRPRTLPIHQGSMGRSRTVT
jgi:hypothetical protein